VKAALEFLEKLTLRPDELHAEDLEPLRAAGCSDEDIRDVTQVCYLFSIYDRMADTLGWRYYPYGDARYFVGAKFLLGRGYKI